MKHNRMRANTSSKSSLSKSEPVKININSTGNSAMFWTFNSGSIGVKELNYNSGLSVTRNAAQ